MEVTLSLPVGMARWEIHLINTINHNSISPGMPKELGWERLEKQPERILDWIKETSCSEEGTFINGQKCFMKKLVI